MLNRKRASSSGDLLPPSSSFRGTRDLTNRTEMLVAYDHFVGEDNLDLPIALRMVESNSINMQVWIPDISLDDKTLKIASQHYLGKTEKPYWVALIPGDYDPITFRKNIETYFDNEEGVTNSILDYIMKHVPIRLLVVNQLNLRMFQQQWPEATIKAVEFLKPKALHVKYPFSDLESQELDVSLLNEINQAITSLETHILKITHKYGSANLYKQTNYLALSKYFK